MTELTHDDLVASLSYDPYTGLFTRKIAYSNNQKVGDLAGSFTDEYVKIGIKGKRYYAHRLAWFYMTGDWPQNEIDHKNADKTDNRFKNLREATRTQNIANKPRLRNNSSGYKGVFWNTQRQKWAAVIKVDGKNRMLGLFDSPVDAHQVYAETAQKTWGEFARAS